LRRQPETHASGSFKQIASEGKDRGVRIRSRSGGACMHTIGGRSMTSHKVVSTRKSKPPLGCLLTRNDLRAISPLVTSSSGTNGGRARITILQAGGATLEQFQPRPLQARVRVISQSSAKCAASHGRLVIGEKGFRPIRHTPSRCHRRFLSFFRCAAQGEPAP
jgi:hypothetical protein